MKITTTFPQAKIPDQYGCNVPAKQQNHGINQRSFPFKVTEIPTTAHYLSWTLIDYDTVPLIGFAWIHWLLADYPLMGSDAAIEANLSTQTTSSQGQNSLRSIVTMVRHPTWFLTQRGMPLATHYAGPRPRGGQHELRLTVYATRVPLRLEAGFTLNQLMHQVDEVLVEQTSLNLSYERKA